MSGRITEVFRQRKSGAERSGSSSKQAPGKEQPGSAASGAGVTTDGDISEEERLLRQFDLDTRYGPCAGLSRMERWQRADKFGLNPPQQVRELLQRLQGEQWDKSIWDGRV